MMFIRGSLEAKVRGLVAENERMARIVTQQAVDLVRVRGQRDEMERTIGRFDNGSLARMVDRPGG